MVALPVELACTCQLKPGLKVFGYGLVEQRALRVAWVVEFGFAPCCPARMRMRLRWAGDGGHGAVPAGAECLMFWGLYPALWFSLLSAGGPVNPELIAGYAHSERAAGQFDSITVRSKKLSR